MNVDAGAFIRQHLQLAPVQGLAGIQLYQAHPGSRLSRLDRKEPPYWAYAWGGGLVLARYLQQNPAAVAGRRVLDIGAGSGLVAVVAARLGAEVSAAEIDPFGQAAIALNAGVNGVAVKTEPIDIAAGAPSGYDLVLAGDVFYRPDVARRMLVFLRRCRAAGLEVLIGDPERRDLPRHALEQIHGETVIDMGGVSRAAGVYVIPDGP